MIAGAFVLPEVIEGKIDAVDHAQALDAVHAQPCVHHRVARVRAHPAGADRVEHGRRALPHVLGQRLVVLHRAAGREFLVDDRRERARRRETAQEPRTRHQRLQVAARGKRSRRDPRFRVRIGRREVDATAARRPAGLRREQEAGERVRPLQRRTPGGVRVYDSGEK